MDIGSTARLLIGLGVLLILAGAVLLAFGKLPGLGRLPGDLAIERGGVRFFFPIVTMLVVSVVLTVIANLFLRFWR
ncbi:MAG: DUF2905 domain-containing protein [Chloroflexi bacterium]|nr:DUF2905 domain-containing protein [Chloroflexota bacterium]MCY3938778.1 DUF2905 domain-containing protein [Chloroflexota bacterium]